MFFKKADFFHEGSINVIFKSGLKIAIGTPGNPAPEPTSAIDSCFSGIKHK